MKNVISSRRAASAILVCAAFLVGSASAQTAPVSIEEVNPAGHWVELKNASASPVDLTGWTLGRLADPSNAFSTTLIATELSGSIPAGGLKVIDLDSMGTSSDRLELSTPALNKSYVTYGTYVPSITDPDHPCNLDYTCNSTYDPVDADAPSGNDSLIFNSYSVWVSATPTRGWWNNASGLGSDTTAPELSAVVSSLSGVSSNLAGLDDPTAASGLYFEKAGAGRVEFSAALNLTDSATLSTLRTLSERLSIDNGRIRFAPLSGSAFQTAATITLSDLPVDRDYTIDDISVLDEAGNVVPAADLVSNVSYSTSTGSGVLSFTTAHFTTFQVATTTDEGGEGGDGGGEGSETNPPTGSILAPAAGTLATTTIDLRATATDTEGAIGSVKFYLDSGNLLGQGDAQGDDEYQYSWNPVGAGFADGAHILYAVIEDLAGNTFQTADQALSLDSTLPVATFNYSTTTTTATSVVATLNANRTVTIENNGGANTYTFAENGSFAFNFIDEVGHRGIATATVTWIDKSEPQITGILPLPGSRVSNGSILIFTDPEQYGDPDCSIVGQPGFGASCVSGTSFAAITRFGNIPNGPFVLKISHRDRAGNLGTTLVPFIKDTVKPVFLRASTTELTQMKVLFNEDLSTDPTAAHYLTVDDFMVVPAGEDEVNPTTYYVPSAVSENNLGEVTLTFAQPITTVYNPVMRLILNPIQAHSIADVAGNVLTARIVATASDAVPPPVTRATTLDENTIELDFGEKFQNTEAMSPEGTDFNFFIVRNGKHLQFTVTGVMVPDDQTIRINLAEAMTRDDSIYYVINPYSKIRDLVGTPVNRGERFVGDVLNTLTSRTGVNTAVSGGGGGGGGGGGTNTVPNSGGVLGAQTFRFLRDLRYCQSLSPDVMELQKRLRAEGYLPKGGVNTNYFGDLTLAAVKKYQAAHNLPATGFVGPQTRAVLNGDKNLDSIASLWRQLMEIQELIKQILQKRGN